MNKKGVAHLLIIFFVFIGLVVVSIVILLNKEMDVRMQSVDKTKTQDLAEEQTKTIIKAKFEIYTFSTKRVFTAAMYHNQSEDVFIQSSDPSVVHVKKKGITWGDFFATLPFSLSKECLITGTKETYCSGETGELKFFLNGELSPNALEKIIENADELVVRFSKDV